MWSVAPESRIKEVEALDDAIKKKSLKMRYLPELVTDVAPITDEELERNAFNCFILSFSWSISLFSPADEVEVVGDSNGCRWY